MTNEDNITNDPQWKELESLLVPSFFTKEKFDSWMLIENPMLGMVAPIDMLFLGRGEKLIKWVKQALAENKSKEN